MPARHFLATPKSGPDFVGPVDRHAPALWYEAIPSTLSDASKSEKSIQRLDTPANLMCGGWNLPEGNSVPADLSACIDALIASAVRGLAAGVA